MENVRRAMRRRVRTLPLETSRPSVRCASLIVWSWARNCGTNRSVIDSTSDSAGATRPNR